MPIFPVMLYRVGWHGKIPMNGSHKKPTGNGSPLHFLSCHSMPVTQAVPVLRVADVARSIGWYQGFLGFEGDPFPETPPYEFATLRLGESEIMLRRAEALPVPKRASYDWDIYLRLESTPFREVYAYLSTRGVVTRRMERMFYGLAEFEITDPDGYVICLSQQLDDASDLPSPETD